MGFCWGLSPLKNRKKEDTIKKEGRRVGFPSVLPNKNGFLLGFKPAQEIIRRKEDNTKKEARVFPAFLPRLQHQKLGFRCGFSPLKQTLNERRK